MRGSAAAHHHHLADRRGPQLRQCRTGDVGGGEGARVGDEDACDVEGDVAVAHDHDALGVEIDVEVGEVGMAVVPTHEGCRAGHSGEIESRQRELPVGGCPARPDHALVTVAQVGQGEVPPDLGVQQDLQSGVARDVVEQLHHLAGVQVIGRDAEPCQPERPVETFVHGDRDLWLPQQLVGRVHRRRARTHDADRDRGVDGQLPRAIDGREGQPTGRVDGEAHGSVGRIVVLGRVDLDEPFLPSRQAMSRDDGADRARTDTCAAVDAGRGIDVQHLGDAEIGLFRRGVDAVDGTCVHARRVAAARLGDDVGHGLGFYLRSGFGFRPRCRWARCGTATGGR